MSSLVQNLNSVDDWKQLASGFTPSTSIILFLYSSQLRYSTPSAIATSQFSTAIQQFSGGVCLKIETFSGWQDGVLLISDVYRVGNVSLIKEVGFEFYDLSL
ncbi:hypothetical protein AA313_de0205834 [Arthrobotrys entomopaga]|nr:hypothetical protein AA313_de0205834 [Arthrobotrys entomopaga]